MKHDIRICMATKGYFCMLDKAVELHVYALYISGRDRISNCCLIHSKFQHANLVLSFVIGWLSYMKSLPYTVTKVNTTQEF